jgi:YesN/AraC family two-component response regulator
MKNDTNIYDIDGCLLRSAGDNTPLSLEEARNRINKYTEKLKELPEDDPKYAVYGTYIRNLSSYIMNLYSKMSPEELKTQFEPKGEQKLSEEVKKAIEDLKKEVEDDTETAGNTTAEISEQHTTDTESSTNEESRDDEAVGRTDSDVHEELRTSQDDLLVEREQTDTVMDEYVEFEEVA